MPERGGCRRQSKCMSIPCRALFDYLAMLCPRFAALPPPCTVLHHTLRPCLHHRSPHIPLLYTLGFPFKTCMSIVTFVSLPIISVRSDCFRPTSKHHLLSHSSSPSHSFTSSYCTIIVSRTHRTLSNARNTSMVASLYVSLINPESNHVLDPPPSAPPLPVRHVLRCGLC